jgi:hypothetical protein
MTGATGAAWDRQPLLWLAALAAGASYMVAVAQAMDGPAIWAWKGAGVALLAAWALANAHGRDGQWIAAMLACGALGDVLIDAVGLTAGALAFIAGHALAIILYRRHRRANIAPSQKALALLLPPATAGIAALLVTGAGDVMAVTLYAAILGLMAATAWISRFTRYLTGLGAMLFVASDLLIFARLGERVDPDFARMLIWPLYFAGQAMIARGVVSRLAE